MNKTKTDEYLKIGAELFKDRIDVDCKHGSGFFKEHVNKDGSVERRPIGYMLGGYWRVKINEFNVSAHRLRWTIENGEIPKNMVINHINNNVNDNSIENLEMVTNSKNIMNASLRNGSKSGVPGVSSKGNKWKLMIGYKNLYITFGTFAELKTARIIRDRYFIKYLLNENIDMSNSENRITFIRSCYESLLLTKEQEEYISQYSHLIYSTVDEISGESYEFKSYSRKNEYSPTKIWKPDPNSLVSIDEQIYKKIIEDFEDRGELGLWRKSKNIYKKIENIKSKTGYMMCKVGAMRLSAHRIIWTLNKGILKQNEIIDHIDGDRGNNRIENLQIVSSIVNNRKQLKHANTMYRHIGVSKLQTKHMCKWNACINMIGGNVYLGALPTEEEAVLIRDRAYVLRLLENPIIKNRGDKNIIRDRCRNKLNLSEKDIELLKNHMTGLNNKDLSVL